MCEVMKEAPSAQKLDLRWKGPTRQVERPHTAGGKAHTLEAVIGRDSKIGHVSHVDPEAQDADDKENRKQQLEPGAPKPCPFSPIINPFRPSCVQCIRARRCMHMWPQNMNVNPLSSGP